MSGPKAGTAVVGGGAVAIVGLAAVAAVALPTVAVGYGVYKGVQAASRGINKAIAERERHKGNMLAEVNSSERPALSLMSNASSRWVNEQKALDTAKKKAESEWAKLKDVPETKKTAEESLRKAEELFAEAQQSYASFGTAETKAKERFNTARSSTGSAQRTVRTYISEGRASADQAVGAANAAAESARQATLVYEETLLIIAQKGTEERRREMHRQDAQSNINAAKNEITAENTEFIGDWLGNESVGLLSEHIKKAEAAYAAKKYGEAKLLSQESVAMYRKFFDESQNVKKKFEDREIIADTLIAALTDLQYDEPDVNYEPKREIANAMLGNLTIFAKAKGETGDMRLSVDLEGNIGIDSDVPEGQESACHQMLTDLQTKVGDVVDFKITDWGRAKNYKPQTAAGVKVQVQQQQQIRQRY